MSVTDHNLLSMSLWGNEETSVVPSVEWVGLQERQQLEKEWNMEQCGTGRRQGEWAEDQEDKKTW
jgi:hypothetical protein